MSNERVNNTTAMNFITIKYQFDQHSLIALVQDLYGNAYQ